MSTTTVSTTDDATIIMMQLKYVPEGDTQKVSFELRLGGSSFHHRKTVPPFYSQLFLSQHYLNGMLRQNSLVLKLSQKGRVEESTLGCGNHAYSLSGREFSQPRVLSLAEPSRSQEPKSCLSFSLSSFTPRQKFVPSGFGYCLGMLAPQINMRLKLSYQCPERTLTLLCGLRESGEDGAPPSPLILCCPQQRREQHFPFIFHSLHSKEPGPGFHKGWSLQTQKRYSIDT